MDQQPHSNAERKNSDDKIPQIPRLHIPRPSLTSSSSSNASTSKSSLIRRAREFSPPSKNFLSGGESETEGIYRSSINKQKSPLDGNQISRSYKNLSARQQEMYLVHKAPKPSSLHSLSSTSSSLSNSGGSNQSNYSVNSLLLSVKNLENFNRTQPHHERELASAAEENPNIILKSNYYLNYFLNQESSRFPMYEHRWKMLQNIKSVTTLDGNDVAADDKNLASMRINQVKDADQLSTTSSTTTTNFTVISLNDSDKRLNRRSKKAICRRTHTITILIIVMTSIFVIVISIMLLLMDMRNQKMPR